MSDTKWCDDAGCPADECVECKKFPHQLDLEEWNDTEQFTWEAPQVFEFGGEFKLVVQSFKTSNSQLPIVAVAHYLDRTDSSDSRISLRVYSAYAFGLTDFWA